MLFSILGHTLGVRRKNGRRLHRHHPIRAAAGRTDGGGGGPKAKRATPLSHLRAVFYLSNPRRSRVLEQRSSSLNPTLHNTEQRLPNKTPLCNLQSGLLLRKTPTEHVRAESRQCNTAQHSGSGQFPRRGCFRLPQSRSPPLLLFRAGLC